MISNQSRIHRVASLLAATLLAVTSAHAEPSAEDLAKIAQNPIGNLISVPFQNNTNFGVGPEDGTQNILNNDLGNKNWGLGPTAVLLKLEKGNPWVYGVLVDNV